MKSVMSFEAERDPFPPYPHACSLAHVLAIITVATESNGLSSAPHLSASFIPASVMSHVVFEHLHCCKCYRDYHSPPGEQRVPFWVTSVRTMSLDSSYRETRRLNSKLVPTYSLQS